FFKSLVSSSDNLKIFRLGGIIHRSLICETPQPPKQYVKNDSLIKKDATIYYHKHRSFALAHYPPKKCSNPGQLIPTCNFCHRQLPHHCIRDLNITLCKSNFWNQPSECAKLFGYIKAKTVDIRKYKLI
ncbi:MAG: hypothetical protein Harvfovirus14_37, partial [Harvfovirus sp.]